ncbi:MAG: iron-containing redox enzyme family protein, partial [Comamonadaceae bacterium]
MHMRQPEVPTSCYQTTYRELMSADSDSQGRAAQAEAFLAQQLPRVEGLPTDLPETPDGLADWMAASAADVTARYGDYLARRKAGGPREFFSNRAHTLFFLQAVAPTKLVDGAWLFGTLGHGKDPRLAGLVQTYLEELGDGDPSK